MQTEGTPNKRSETLVIFSPFRAAHRLIKTCY